MGPPRPPSLELPKPPVDLRATRKGDRVVLTWTAPSLTTDRETIRSLGVTRICRASDPAISVCGEPVGQATPVKPVSDNKPSNKKTLVTYTDAIPSALETDDAAAQITYAVEVLNAGGRSAGLSNRVQISSVRTLPAPATQVSVTKEGVVVSWSAGTSGDPLGHKLRIFRRLDGAEKGSMVGEVVASSGTAGTFTDQAFEWEKIYYYHTAFVTVIAGQNRVDVEGNDSPEVKVFADDVFPPAVPSGLQAVFSGPGQQGFIDLIWAPVTDADLEGYFVYRREAGGVAVKLNAEAVRAPAFRDSGVVAGKGYFYSVAAVDVRGNESGRSEEAGEGVP